MTLRAFPSPAPRGRAGPHADSFPGYDFLVRHAVVGDEAVIPAVSTIGCRAKRPSLSESNSPYTELQIDTSRR
jgi:hypothetical protein